MSGRRFTLACAVVLGLRLGESTFADWTYNPTTKHWYMLTVPGTWEEAEVDAKAQGGYLVVVNDAQEQAWLCQNFPDSIPIWIGLRQLPDSVEPGDGWFWINGDPLSYLNWGSGEPNDGVIHGPHYEQYGETNHASGCPGFWNDITGTAPAQTGIIERECPPGIDCPTISEWGMLIMALATLSVGTVILLRLRPSRA